MHWILCALGMAACSTASEPPPANLSVSLQVVASGLSSPLYLTAPAGDPRLFVVEQPGRIRIVKNGQLLSAPFLDIVSKVSSGGERGLLSVAFHPGYSSNGFLYVNYTDLSGNTRVERYHVGANPDLADPASAKLILGVTQPYPNHNGGLVLFGPDGMLYVGMGDGGSGGDPQGNGQSLGTLLGKLLRIDIDRGDPYAVPPDNPFVSTTGARGEIWAYGLRNPWRYAFDRVAGLLYIADVGQDAWEEVDVAPTNQAGLNYGWSVMEGMHCFNSSSCSTQGLTLPVLEYGHSEGCSVTGGLVYRGKAIPEIVGHYFYGDYCRGWIRSFRYANQQVQDQASWSLGSIGEILSFGEDASGELYVMSDNGRVYRFVKG